MKILRDEPYALPVAADIVARISAVNINGTGIVSFESKQNAVKVIKPLERMAKPTFTRIDYESMKVQWNESQAAESYSLVWDKGDPNSTVD